MSYMSVAAAATAGVGSLFKIGEGMHQNHLASKIDVPDVSYEQSPYALKMLGEAERLKNANMPGYNQEVANIEGNQANTTDAAARGASSGSQFLSILGAIQGNSNNAFNKLGINNEQYARDAESNYNNALGTMINEGDKVYQDKVRQQEMAINQKNALRGAAAQNIGGGINDLTDIGFLLAQQNNNNK